MNLDSFHSSPHYPSSSMLWAVVLLSITCSFSLLFCANRNKKKDGIVQRTEPIKPPPTTKKEETTPGIQSSLMLSKKEEKVDRRLDIYSDPLCSMRSSAENCEDEEGKKIAKIPKKKEDEKKKEGEEEEKKDEKKDEKNEEKKEEEKKPVEEKKEEQNKSAEKEEKRGSAKERRGSAEEYRQKKAMSPSTAHLEHFDPRNYDDILDIYEAIKVQLPDEFKSVTIGIICGSGLGTMATLLKDTFVLPYSKIPGFPIPSVQGHKGNLVFGYLHEMKVVCQQGRFHPYEHEMNLALCSTPVRIFHLLGVSTMIVSNAAGGINTTSKFGDLMIIKDHIFLPGLSGFSPLVGISDDRFGVRFVSVHDCYDRTLRRMAATVADKQGVPYTEGIYVMSGGPQYESPAEVRLFKTVGADALGMSTCHEVTVARQLGIRVFGFSLITNMLVIIFNYLLILVNSVHSHNMLNKFANLDADTSVVVSHEEVLQTADEAGERATNFIGEVLLNISKMPTHKSFSSSPAESSELRETSSEKELKKEKRIDEL
ncbi:hypothetical protein PRIPAC_83057 [Pristionchus pacificus]|uniref:Purine nucleoside phosphorylase n=1 Tax=Pristionchus pacificus TaxID=54126 RepID=A0A2A6CBA9_PRIPA|nr:hypothetical protein PRIPAC_83057 [Pristionchus pacificus]|eukprot:PDM75407.1 hypothetical protein PRIPAC_42584 [Pristionchus pacificus]